MVRTVLPVLLCFIAFHAIAGVCQAAEQTPSSQSASAAVGGTTKGSQATVTEAKYSYASLDYPGAVDTQPFGINDKGDIVGSFSDGTGPEHAFTYIDGKFAEVLAPVLDWNIEFYAINETGQILGETYADVDGTTHMQPLLYDDRAILPLTLSSDGKYIKLDNNEELDGQTSLSEEDLVDFLGRRAGSFYVSFPNLKVTGPEGHKLLHYVKNRSGNIVGYDVNRAGFVTIGGVTSSPVPDRHEWDPGAIAGDINDHDAVVGAAACTNYLVTCGFISTSANFNWIDPPQSRKFPQPWSAKHYPHTECTAINNANVVIGYYYGSDGSTHGFVAKPN